MRINRATRPPRTNPLSTFCIPAMRLSPFLASVVEVPAAQAEIHSGAREMAPMRQDRGVRFARERRRSAQSDPSALWRDEAEQFQNDGEQTDHQNDRKNAKS